MSDPANTATTTAQNQEQTPPSFEQQVNEVTKALKQNDEGIWEFPEDLKVEEPIKVAAIAEKRRRDTQSALAKTKSELAIAKAKSEELAKLVSQTVTVNLSDEEKEELQELKFSDPEAWRDRMNKLEEQAKKQIDTTMQEIDQKAVSAGSTADREVILQAFLQDNPGVSINDEVIANDVPPRITRKLENGDVTFLEFLTEVRDYLKAGKVIKNTPGSNSPNLSDVGGSDNPDAVAVTKDAELSYEDEIF